VRINDRLHSTLSRPELASSGRLKLKISERSRNSKNDWAGKELELIGRHQSKEMASGNVLFGNDRSCMVANGMTDCDRLDSRQIWSFSYIITL